MPFANASNSGVYRNKGIINELNMECTMFPGNKGMGTAKVAKVKNRKNTRKIAALLIYYLFLVASNYIHFIRAAQVKQSSGIGASFGRVFRYLR
jgi:hypothetical protein